MEVIYHTIKRTKHTRVASKNNQHGWLQQWRDTKEAENEWPRLCC